MRDDEVFDLPDEQTILKSNSALGHGIMNDLYHIVYVKTKDFSSSNNMLIAREIEKINRRFVEKGKNYILVGPGRWGSSDTALGIPVKWPHISNARLIVESALKNYRIEPSQGTHFFQNLTSFGVGYFTINPFMNDGFFDEAYLEGFEAEEETRFLRVIQFEKPVVVKINGKKNIGLVLKPGIVVERTENTNTI